MMLAPRMSAQHIAFNARPVFAITDIAIPTNSNSPAIEAKMHMLSMNLSERVHASDAPHQIKYNTIHFVFTSGTRENPDFTLFATVVDNTANGIAARAAHGPISNMTRKAKWLSSMAKNTTKSLSDQANQ